MTVFALLGSTALWLLYAWLASAIIASYLSGRKGYGERVGLASGLLLNAIGVLIWLVVPPKQDSLWKKVGPFGSSDQDAAAARRAARAGTRRTRLSRLAGALGVPARLRHGHGDQHAAALAGARRDLAPHELAALVVDHEPERVAEHGRGSPV